MSSKKANVDIAQKLNITARKGDTFRLSVTFTDSSGAPIGVSDYTYRMQVRSSATDDSASGAIIEISGDSVSDGFDTSGGGGKVVINIPSSKMSEIDGGKYVYDLEATNTTDTSLVQTWLRGGFSVNEDVTVNA
mgnify:CR=1 FL=1